jgi:outer membrane protein
MKKGLIWMAVLTFCLAPLALRAATTPMKIGVIDVNKILNETEEGHKIKKQLEEEMGSKRKAIEDKKREFDKLEEEFQKQQLVLSKEAVADKRAELEKKRAELGRLFLASQGEMEKRDQEQSDQMLKKIVAVVTKVGLDQKYDMIVDKKGLVVYARDGLDVTDPVIKLYNQTNPAKK